MIGIIASLILLCQIINVGCVARTKIIFHLSIAERERINNALYEDTLVKCPFKCHKVELNNETVDWHITAIAGCQFVVHCSNYLSGLMINIFSDGLVLN